MSQADSRQIVKSILSSMKELFKNSTRGARTRAWDKFYSKRGNEEVRKLINNPSLTLNHFDSFLTFKEWITTINESVITSGQDLPPIPSGMTRLSNVTSQRAVQAVMAGQPFTYGRGMISSTADSFSNNDQVFQLLTKLTYGAFDRSSFGTDVILIDMLNDQYRTHNSAAQSPGSVDNRCIVGYVDTKNMQFIPNRNYNPASVQVQIPNKPERQYTQPAAPTPIPGANTTPSANLDIW